MKILNNQLQTLWKQMKKIENLTKNIKVIFKRNKSRLYKGKNTISEIKNSLGRLISGMEKTEESVNMRTNQYYSPK